MTPSLMSEVREVSPSTYPLLVHPKVPQKCHRKPSLLRGEHSEPCKVTLSLSSVAREVFLPTYPLLSSVILVGRYNITHGGQSRLWTLDAPTGEDRIKGEETLKYRTDW